MFLNTANLCKSKPIPFSPTYLLLSLPFSSSTPQSLSQSQFQESLQTILKTQNPKHLAHLFLTQYPTTTTTNNNPFSFLTPQNQTQIVSQILQSLNSLKPPRPKHIYQALLSQTTQPISLPLALAVLQSMIRIDCKPTCQTRLSLSSTWCKRRNRSTPREILSEMRNLGYPPDLNTCNYLIGTLSAEKNEAEARAVLRALRGAGILPDAESFHLVIAAACRMGDTEEARGLVEEMVAGERLVPKRRTVVRVLGAMKKGKGCREMFGLLGLLEREGCEVGFDGYEMVVESCLDRREFVMAGKVVLEMVGKGMLPYIGVRLGVVEGLLGVGERDMAWAIKRRFVELGC